MVGLLAKSVSAVRVHVWLRVLHLGVGGLVAQVRTSLVFIFVGRRGPQKDRWCSTERPRASRELWGVLSVPCGKLPPNLPLHVATFVTDTRVFPARRLRKSNLHEIPIFTTETDTFFTSTRHAHFLMIFTLCQGMLVFSRFCLSFHNSAKVPRTKNPRRRPLPTREMWPSFGPCSRPQNLHSNT